MGIKKNLLYSIICLFLVARIAFVFPFSPAHFSTITTLSSLSSFNTAHQTNAGDTDPADDAEDEKKEDGAMQKDNFKDAIKDYYHTALAGVALYNFHTHLASTLFHLHIRSEQRKHVNEVFRPPLV